MFDLIGQVWPVKVLVCVLLLVKYMQHKHLALPHFLNPVCSLRPAPCLLSTSVWEFCSHQDISEVGRPQVSNHGRPRHPLLHLWVSLNKKLVVLSKDPRRIWEPSIERKS